MALDAGKRPAPREERMPIEELARRTAMTVRNLRALQGMGLLDAPELEGRKGFYSARHLARVRLVRKLQERGFTLGSIRELIAQWSAGGGLTDLAGIEDALLTPVSAIGRSSAKAAEIFPELVADARLLQRAIELELCVLPEDGEPMAPSAELLRIVHDLTSAGIPLPTVLQEVATLRADMERITARFRVLFRTHVDARYRGARSGELANAIRRLPAESVRAVTILLSQAIERGAPSTPPPQAPARTPRNRKPPPQHGARSRAKRVKR
jgi:DNA-binding transcriptional MerR regulator